MQNIQEKTRNKDNPDRNKLHLAKSTVKHASKIKVDGKNVRVHP